MLVDAEARRDDPQEAVSTGKPPLCPRRLGAADALLLGGYLLFALLLTAKLWIDPQHRYLAFSIADQQGFEWAILNTARAIADGHSPLFTPLQNAPLGINMMAQTSILALSIPLLPVTLLLGPEVTFALILTLGLAGTAAAWYWLFLRHLVADRVAAGIGGAVCGFGPPMISHANGGHLNFIALFLLPIILRYATKLGEPGRWWRNGLILGVLAAVQIFIGEEPLLLAALGSAVFLLAYAVMRPRESVAMLRSFLPAAGVAVLAAAVLAGYPLWWQFFGPQAYWGVPHAALNGNDLFSLTTFASQSLGGHHPVTAKLAMNPTEENGFFGWSLLALSGVCAVWLWRRSIVARAATVTAVVFLIGSLGSNIKIDGRQVGPGPWRIATHLPLVGAIIPSRLVFVALPAVAALLTLATARINTLRSAAAGSGVPLRLLWYGAVAAALLPITPTPLDTVTRPDAPVFFTSGAWREYVGPGRSVLAVPVADGSNQRPLRWQVAAGMGFAQPEGYFIGPHGADRHGWYGAQRRPTAALLAEVAQSGHVPTVSDVDRRQAHTDLRYWQVDAIVLADGGAHQWELLRTVNQLVGPGKRIDDVWVWDVRAAVAG